jgi:tetratricopeptide (TPR) repeat protein
MEKEAKSGGDLLALVAWADARRKQLMWTAAAVAAVGLLVGLYFMHKNSHEAAGNAAFFALKLPVPGKDALTAADAAPFAQVADDYSDTTGGARAMLMAGRIYFEAGDFEKARAMFQRMLAEHSDYPLANEAAIGVALSLEAEGKLAEATARMEDIVRRGPQDSTWTQAQSALGRLYTEQNHPDRALEAYKQLLSANDNDSWTMEARPQISDLLDKYPALRQQLAPPAKPATPPVLDVGKP